MAGSIKFMLPLAVVFAAACVAEPGKTSLESRVADRSLPLLDRSLAPELAAATFATG